tara:strand:- start:841 stop:1170 length:330 start_codon:yes stop_codon:yes gene_type:complete
MINYDSLTGTISVNGPSKYSTPVIKDQTDILVYYNSSDNIIEFHQQGEIIYTEPVPPISLPPPIKEEKKIEKRIDQTYTDILEIFSEHQDQSFAEEEEISNLSIKYILW